jgi:hypothetical protein
MGMNLLSKRRSLKNMPTPSAFSRKPYIGKSNQTKTAAKSTTETREKLSVLVNLISVDTMDADELSPKKLSDITRPIINAYRVEWLEPIGCQVIGGYLASQVAETDRLTAGQDRPPGPSPRAKESHDKVLVTFLFGATAPSLRSTCLPELGPEMKFGMVGSLWNRFRSRIRLWIQRCFPQTRMVSIS